MRKSGASMYGTPTGTLTPLPMAQFNEARPSSKRKPAPQQPAPPSGGTDGVSSWVLSQKLLALQEQQEEKQKQQVKAVATRNNPGAVLQWLLQWEQRIVFMLVRHRLWLYWLVILWVLFGRARLSTLWRQRTRLPALLARLSMLSAKRLT
ncbi:hypothetical protein BC940DRAFT_293148 [Gongronella butleri]|nr:hypothetical protein BC940DRAFT_293148 [Gongronella butleri]